MQGRSSSCPGRRCWPRRRPRGRLRLLASAAPVLRLVLDLGVQRGPRRVLVPLSPAFPSARRVLLLSAVVPTPALRLPPRVWGERSKVKGQRLFVYIGMPAVALSS